jgi:hypothetical protein
VDPLALRVAKRWKEKVPGGLARVPPKVDPKQVEKGIKVEREHTDDPDVAREIAYDHLTEDSVYYDKLEEMEKKGAADLSTPQKAAEHLQSKLKGMFPDHYVEVTGERGVGISVGRLSEEEYAKEQVASRYSNPPNLMVKIVIAPFRMGPSTWANLNLNPASDNPELREAGIQTIRRAGGLTPEEAVSRVLKWFAKNERQLKAQGIAKTSGDRLSVIRQEEGKYCVRSPSNPDWSGGCFDTKEEAGRRLREVEYFKHKDAAWRVVLAFAKSKGIAFNKLKSMSKKELEELGCTAWDDPKDGKVTMLFPAEWYDEIPNGLDVVDIFGEAEEFQRGKSDKDQRMGFLPYGVLVKIARRYMRELAARQKSAARMIKIDPDEVDRLLGEFQEWAADQAHMRGYKDPASGAGPDNAYLGHVTLQTPWGEGRDILVAFFPGDGIGGAFSLDFQGSPLVKVFFNGGYHWGTIAKEPAVVNELRPLLKHELTHALDHFEGVAQLGAKSGQTTKLEELGVSPAQYFNDPMEVRAYLRQVYEEIEQGMQRLLRTPLAQRLGMSVLLMSELRNSSSWRMMVPHLTPANRNRILKGLVTEFSDQLKTG